MGPGPGRNLPHEAQLSYRAQSTREEIANGVSHGVALVASIAAILLLLQAKSRQQDMLQITGSAVFGITLIVLYAASTLYHSIPLPRAKRILRVLDHGAIYLLIAGTYTPFMLGPLRGPVGWTLLVTIWLLAFLGILAKCLFRFRFPRLSTVLYLAMGWLILVAFGPLIAHVPSAGLWWLLAGGLFYTGGVVFYATDHCISYGHTIWHGFVAAGSVCHFFAVFWYATPPVG